MATYDVTSSVGEQTVEAHSVEVNDGELIFRDTNGNHVAGFAAHTWFHFQKEVATTDG